MLQADVNENAGIAGRGTIPMLMPCYNGEAPIGKVVTDFYPEPPDAGLAIHDSRTIDAVWLICPAPSAPAEKSRRS